MKKGNEDPGERCALCGNPTDAATAFCHFYLPGERLTFCRPACAQRYLQAGAAVVFGADALLQEMHSASQPLRRVGASAATAA